LKIEIYVFLLVSRPLKISEGILFIWFFIFVVFILCSMREEWIVLDWRICIGV